MYLIRIQPQPLTLLIYNMNSTLVGIKGDGQKIAHRDIQFCWQTDGLNDYGLYPFSPAQCYNFFPDKKFTVCGWTNVATITPSHFFFCDIGVVSNSNSNTFQFIASQTGAGAQFIQWQAGGVILTITRAYNLQSLLPTISHVAITSDGLNNASSIKTYINGRRASQLALGSAANLGLNTFSTPSGEPTLARGDDSGPIFPVSKFADLIFCTNYEASGKDIRRIYNSATNNKISYSARYPSDLLSNRFAHYTFHPDDFEVVGLNLFAKDVSGNNRHLKLFGQGTTPTIVPFY
jgi:hypothetical protein